MGQLRVPVTLLVLALLPGTSVAELTGSLLSENARITPPAGSPPLKSVSAGAIVAQNRPSQPSGTSCPNSDADPSLVRYGSPDGGGNGLTVSSPYRISDFLDQATAGWTLCLTDGTYQGAAGMIRPPAGRSGTSTARITIAAMNEGQVIIDGQFQSDDGSPRVPLWFTSNSWFLIQGINFRNSIRHVAVLGGPDAFDLATASTDNIIRRSIFWDANGTDNAVVALHAPGLRNLWEDSAFFGTGRSIWQVYTGQDNICRRCWIREEGNMSNSGPVHGFVPNYGGSSPTSRTICENCLFTWYALSMPQNYTDGHDGTPYTGFAMAGQRSAAQFGEGNCGESQQYKIFGSLSYLRAGDSISANSDPLEMAGDRRSNDVLFRDMMVVVPPGFPNSVAGFVLGDFNCGTRPNTSGNVAQNITSVGVSFNNIHSSWSIIGHATASTVSGLGSNGPFTATSPGANLCFRYLNGVRTITPLWPWPMNERIKQALAQAGSYSGPCINCEGGRFNRAGTADPTADVETLLGTIPSGCKATSPEIAG